MTSRYMVFALIFSLSLLSAISLELLPIQTRGFDRAFAIQDGIETKKRITLHQAAVDPLLCTKYDPVKKLITVTCKTASLSSVANGIKNPAVLKDTDGTWLLNANMTVAKDASLTIDSNDTKWLKINSTTSKDSYHIDVLGSLKIDSVKISSWNTTSNTYTSTNGTVHRPSIAILPRAEGKMDVINSEISYLGYDSSPRQGLYFGSGNGSTIINNTIHHMWFGFYSKGTGNITMDNNEVFANEKYGLDPHTGTQNMIIRNNTVHGNGHIGIICSLDCRNIIIEGNKVFNNTNSGIMLSRNVKDSTVRANEIKNENTGISISDSHNNKVEGNLISQSIYGIQLKAGSSKNVVEKNLISSPNKYGILLADNVGDNNIIQNRITNSSGFGICVNQAERNAIVGNVVGGSGRHGICLNNDSKGNYVQANLIDQTTGYGIYVSNSNSKDNTFVNNTVRDAKIGVVLSNSTDSEFRTNEIGPVTQYEYAAADNSSLKLNNTNFTQDKIRSLEGNNSVSIFDSGSVGIGNGTKGNMSNFDTNKDPYSISLSGKNLLTLNTVK
jgi:mannuronan 5-epimerase